MPLDLLIHNAVVVTPETIAPGAVAVRDGRIVAVVRDTTLPEAATVVDAGGRYLLPGVVDIHVHFREPGQEYKATYASESAAAAVGGVTAICDMPNNGQRAVVDPDRVRDKIAVASASSLVDFGIYAYLVAATEHDQRALLEAGAIGFKWDMSLAGTEVAPGRRLPAPEEALPHLRAAATLGAFVGIHAEDRTLTLRRTAELRAAGRSDARAHLDARPVEAELIALRQAIELARRSGVRLHIHHLSSAAGLELVRAAKREGLPVTAETIPPFLFCDAEDYAALGTILKIHPAVKYREDREALWEGLRDGSIDCLATDHAPHTAEEKRRGVWEASPGAIGVQTSLPLLLSAVAAGELTLARAVEVLAAAPARLHGLYPRKGAILPGADADLVLVDLEARHILRNEEMLSPNQLTPFHGREVRGLPVLTVRRGQVIARAGVPVTGPGGQLLRPGSGAITRPPVR